MNHLSGMQTPITGVNLLYFYFNLFIHISTLTLCYKQLAQSITTTPFQVRYELYLYMLFFQCAKIVKISITHK